MELEARLRAFAAVARAGSFSQAADLLHVSQPAVSKQVAVLEAELGKQLLIRGSRGVTLTAAGQVLADYVLRAEALLANARRALGAGEDAQIGTLSLAASGVPGTYLVPTTLAGFRDLHPRSDARLPGDDVRRCGRARSCTRGRAGDRRRADLAAGARGRTAGRRRARARGTPFARRPTASATGSEGTDLDRARGGLGDACERRHSPLGARPARCAHTRAPVVGSGQAGGRRAAPGSQRSAASRSTSSCARDRWSSSTCRVGACGERSPWSRPGTFR